MIRRLSRGATAGALFAALIVPTGAAADPGPHATPPFDDRHAGCSDWKPFSECSASASPDGDVHLRAEVPLPAGPAASAAADAYYDLTFVLDEPVKEVQITFARTRTITTDSIFGTNGSVSERATAMSCSCSTSDTSSTADAASVRVRPAGPAEIPAGPLLVRWHLRAAASRSSTCPPTFTCQYPVVPVPAGAGGGRAEVTASITGATLEVVR